MTNQIAQGVLQAMTSDPGRGQLAAVTREVTQTAVQQMVAALGSQQTRAHLVGLTHAVAEAALKQAASSMQTEFRPVVRAMIQEDVAQGMAHALATDLKPQLGQTAQNVAYHAMLGANGGLGDAWRGSDGMSGEARMASAGFGPTSQGWLWGGLTLMGLVTLMLVSGAVMMVARARRTRAGCRGSRARPSCSRPPCASARPPSRPTRLSPSCSRRSRAGTSARASTASSTRCGCGKRAEVGPQQTGCQSGVPVRAARRAARRLASRCACPCLRQVCLLAPSNPRLPQKSRMA